MFIDEIKLVFQAGKGGDGAVSFRREKFVPKGGPDGGNGGRGGSIIIKSNNNLNTLNNLAHKKIFKAENGENGMGSNCYGKNAENLTIEVPVGTIIFDLEQNKAIIDLDKNDMEFVVAKGGKGGLGNKKFTNSIHQAPKFAEKGEPGEKKEIKLELKMVADVGIIGLPSAGKSSLISVISNARPKIADYHFTTLSPNLGIVNLNKYSKDDNSTFLVADIPGLIEGASQGRGLGHEFLKHISRTKILVHLLDVGEENLYENYKTIRKELTIYDKNLGKKEQILVFNKIDLLSNDILEQKKKIFIKQSKIKEIYLLSCTNHIGVKELLFKIKEILSSVKKKENNKKNKIIPVIKTQKTNSKFIVEKIIMGKDSKTFVVTGNRIEQLILMTDINNREALERIYNFIIKSGLQKELEKKNATYGDIILIKNKQIPFRK